MKDMSGRALGELLSSGRAPDPAALAGWEWRGWNQPAALALLGIRKFIKGFFSGSAGLEGYNRPVVQDGFDAEWRAKGEPFGFYRVAAARAPDDRHPNSLLLDYGASRRNAVWKPERLLRDYLVQPDPAEPDVLLGRATLALGPARPATNFFLLERLAAVKWLPLIALLLCAGSARAAEPKAPGTLRVLTLNVAGIPVVHPRLGRRVAAIGRALADGGYDLVALQEVWRDGDSEALARASGLSYAARYGRSLALGSGLTILSRWPIVRTEERVFSALRPSLMNLAQGEPLAHKGFLMARVATPWGELDVYDTHAIADYRTSLYQGLRLTQIFDLAEGARELSPDRPFLVLGDFNAGPGERDFEAFKSLLGLRDLCAPDGREVCGDPNRPRRIDHMLVPGRLNGRARRVLDTPIPGSAPPLAYSDHFGFAADVPAFLFGLRARPDPARRAAALREVEEVIARMIERLAARRLAKSWIPLYGAALSARYDRQLALLAALRERVAASRLKP